MKQIVIEVSETTAEALAKLALECSEMHRTNGGITSHGALTLSELLTMLVDDAGMVINQPGGWEASNMRRVLASHGYNGKFSASPTILVRERPRADENWVEII